MKIFRILLVAAGIAAPWIAHASPGQRLRTKLGLPTDQVRPVSLTAVEVSSLKQALAELDYDPELGWSQWIGYWKTQLLFFEGKNALSQGRLETAERRLSVALDRTVHEKNPAWLNWHGLQAAVQAWKQSGEPKAARSVLRRSLERVAAWVPVNSQERRVIAIRTEEMEKRAPREDSRVQGYAVIQKSPDQRALQTLLADVFMANPIPWQRLSDQLDAWLVIYPRSIDVIRARYWRAQAQAHVGNPLKGQLEWREVATHYPLTYYGLLSAIALGRPITEAVVATLPESARVAPVQGSWGVVSEAMLDALDATRQGERERARDAWGQACRSSDYPTFVLIQAASAAFEAQAYRCTATWLSEVGRRVDRAGNALTEVSSWSVQKIFPTDSVEWVTPAAQAAGIEPTLLVSLAKQESGLDPSIASSVGALGLTQVMPATAVDVDATVLQQDLLVPQVNTRLGATYLAGLLRRYQGKLPLALAGYNAGPGRVDAWVRQFGSGGDIFWIERVPFQETREYIQAILRNMAWYRYVLGDSSMPIIDNLKVL